MRGVARLLKDGEYSSPGDPIFIAFRVGGAETNFDQGWYSGQR